MTGAAPTTAERIRSACVRAGGAMLAVEGLEPISTPLHHLLDDGSFAITVPGDGILAGMVVAAGTAGVQAVLEMTDYAPLPLREPVRSLVWIRGRLHAVPDSAVAALLDLIAIENPNPALLQVNSDGAADARYTLMRLEIETVVVADSTGAESIGVGALLGASPDPFCAMESCWLQHMESAHREVVDRLGERQPHIVIAVVALDPQLHPVAVKAKRPDPATAQRHRQPAGQPVDDLAVRRLHVLQPT